MGVAKDTGDLACKVSKQGKQTECFDPNETVHPDQWIGTNGLHQFEETQGEGPKDGDTILSQEG